MLLGHYLVQDLQADFSKCMRKVCEGMKEGVPILDEIDITSQEVQHEGFVGLGKEPIRRAQGVRDRSEGVAHQLIKIKPLLPDR